MSVFLILLVSIALFLIMPLILSFSWSSSGFLKHSREEIAKSARLNGISVRKMTEMYQDTIAQAATLVLMDPALSEIAEIKSLDTVRNSVESIRKINDAVGRLEAMTYFNNLKIDSVYYYVEGSDYILTSDIGAVRLNRFTDTGYADIFKSLLEYPHRSLWIARAIPILTIEGIDYENVPYITYANISNPIVSRVRGAIFVNIRESIVSGLLNSSEFDKDGHISVIDGNGVILSHVDKNMVLRNIGETYDLSEVTGASDETVSFLSSEPGGGTVLLISSVSPKTGWTFLSTHSMDSLMRNIRALMRRTVVLVSVIVLLGSVLILFITSRISVPLRKLIFTLSQSGIGDMKKKIVKNEFEYLLESFRLIQAHETTLTRKIDESRNKLRESGLAELLRGDSVSLEENPFSGACGSAEGRFYRVLVFSFDGKSDIVRKYSAEQRFYYLSLLSAECERRFSEDFSCFSLQIDGNVAVILNYDAEREDEPVIVRTAVKAVQEKFLHVDGSTVSVGISSPCEVDPGVLSTAYAEALEALKYRLLDGYGMVREWAETAGYEYRYPYDLESALINNLKLADTAGVETGLDQIFSCFRRMSCDDILHAVNQLCGVLVGFMKENNIRRDSSGAFDIYGELSSRETLEEKKAFIAGLCRDIAEKTNSGASLVVDRMLDYIRKNYTSIPDFELMAQSVGVSYSYMRRLMKDFTGRSILDHVNSLRVEAAKSMLGSSDTGISSIARELGYMNIQSFERFFRKYTGISPQDYRKISQAGTPEVHRNQK